MGGTDTYENLVEVTITQHAMFHYCNYQLWGNEEDRIAWRMLSGQISVDEAKLEAIKLGSKNGVNALKEKFKDPEKLKEHKEKCKKAFNNSPHKEDAIKRCKINQSKAVEASRTSEARKKQKQKLNQIKHQQGEKNSQYGTMWITDGTKEGSYRIKKGDPIPEGFKPGRVCYKVIPKGENTSNFGKIWINNGQISKMIHKNQPIPEGFVKGRANFLTVTRPLDFS